MGGGGTAFAIPPFLLPAPSAIAQAMHEYAAVLIKNSVVTTLEILLGFGLSVAVGVPLALAIFLWKPFARAVYPVLVSSQAVPKVAVAPLFLVWFGFGLLPKVLIAFLIAFFPVVINTAIGLAAVEREKIYLAQSMGLRPRGDILQDPTAECAAIDFRGPEDFHHARRCRRRCRRVRRRPGGPWLSPAHRQRQHGYGAAFRRHRGIDGSGRDFLRADRARGTVCAAAARRRAHFVRARINVSAAPRTIEWPAGEGQTEITDEFPLSGSVLSACDNSGIEIFA